MWLPGGEAKADEGTSLLVELTVKQRRAAVSMVRRKARTPDSRPAGGVPAEPRGWIYL